jgi:uncharacterized protein YbjT (DUF2867 family)
VNEHKEDAMNEQSKTAVVGATGRLGRHLVDVLGERGHEVVPISRSTGVDVITGEGLEDALAGVDNVVDAASWPTPDEGPATEFFTTAAGNLHEAGSKSGVKRLVVVSIIGTDRFTAGYYKAKRAHELAVLSGPIPVRILRAGQFHEFVEALLEWGTRDGTAQVWKMRTQLVAARTVAEALADLTDAEDVPSNGFPEIAGPREETMLRAARKLVEHRGDSIEVEEWSDPENPDRELFENGALLPGPQATLAGPTYEEWLESSS